MSKKRTTTRRKGKRRSTKTTASRRSQMIQLGIGGVVLVGLVFLIVSSGGGLSGDAPEVSEGRLNLDPYLGNPGAPVTIVEYSAYACEACRQWHQAGIIERLLEEFEGQLVFKHRDYPVISPSYDRMAANTAQCVLDQGMAEFWQFHDYLYTRLNGGASQEDLIQTAGRIPGLDTDALRECAESGANRATVQYDEDRGNDLGLRGAPVFFVNDRQIYTLSPDAIRSAIIAELGA